MLVIEYYLGTLPLSKWEVTDWGEEHECDFRVVYLNLIRRRRGKDYTTRVSGSDYYCVQDGYLYCWVDPSQPWASKSRVGSRWDLNSYYGIDIKEVPIIHTKIRKGIMVPGHHARELGLI